MSSWSGAESRSSTPISTARSPRGGASPITSRRPRRAFITAPTISNSPSGDDLIAGGRAAGAAAAKDYETNRYHGPADELDATWNWAGIAADLDLYYTVGRALANDSTWPNWVAGDEFRGVRDASRAGK
jgi:hypothetical protein